MFATLQDQKKDMIYPTHTYINYKRHKHTATHTIINNKEHKCAVNNMTPTLILIQTHYIKERKIPEYKACQVPYAALI
jgi:hypothetical protein